MEEESNALLTSWVNWTTLAANVLTVAGGICVVFAGRRFFRNRRYDEYLQVYRLANDLFRSGLSIQKRKKESRVIEQVDRQRVFDAKNSLANWFYDNRYLFQGDKRLCDIMKSIDNEADEIISCGRMDNIVDLRRYLEEYLKKAP